MNPESPTRPRYLLIGPRPAHPRQWLSMSRYSSGLASLLAPGADVEQFQASHWNPPPAARFLFSRYKNYKPFPRRWPTSLDLVHFTDIHLTVHARRFDVPRVATIHDLIPMDYGRMWPPIATYGQFIYRRSCHALRHLDAIITPSEDTRQKVISRLDRAPERVFTVPVLIPGHLSPAITPAPRDPRTILSVGTSADYKNLPALLHALAAPELAGCRLVRVGEAFTPGQAALAQKLGVASRIEHRGHVSEDGLVALLRSATVLAQPSLTEGFGMPVAEAMACGLPVVVSNGGALPEVAGRAGRVVPFRNLGSGPINLDDARDFARALAAVVEDPGLQQAMSAAGLAEVERFRAPAVRDRLLEAYSAAAAR